MRSALQKAKLGTQKTPNSRVDKKSHMPAYFQLAQNLRQSIADETYPPGSRLPAESVLAINFGVSAMTARQAVGVLAEEGLVERMQGSGTYVRRVQIAKGYFTLDALYPTQEDESGLDVKIQKVGVEKAGAYVAKRLGLKPGTPTVVVERLLLRHGDPLFFQVAITRSDPKSPIVEAMLDSALLTGLLPGKGPSSFKKGELRLLPVILEEYEAGQLGDEAGAPAFKVEHLFFDFNDRPASFGWILAGPRQLPLSSRLGVWDD